MLTVGELKDICAKLEREHGSDTSVVIQMRNEDGSLLKGDYCLSCYKNEKGTLFLQNKHLEYE